MRLLPRRQDWPERWPADPQDVPQPAFFREWRRLSGGKSWAWHTDSCVCGFCLRMDAEAEPGGRAWDHFRWMQEW